LRAERGSQGCGIVITACGGLIVATILTLLILPTLYFVMERWIARRFPAAALARTSGV
jgi:hypothetical protein